LDGKYTHGDISPLLLAHGEWALCYEHCTNAAWERITSPWILGRNEKHPAAIIGSRRA
jgi:hypothetical protein